ncbi:MAG: response regulator [Bacteroidota bacterium]
MNTILTTITGLLSVIGITPYDYCYFSQPATHWLQTLPDGLINTVYSIIPFTIFLLVGKRQSTQSTKAVLYLFLLFSLSNGFILLTEIYAIWYPTYQVPSWVKILNISVLFATTLGLWPHIVRLLRGTSTIISSQVGDESETTRERELQLREDNLEELVNNRTKDLENTLLQLKHEARDRQRAQDQVKFQTSLLDQVDSSIIATDTHRKIVYWNHHAEQLFGWTKEEALGRKTSELFKDKQAANETYYRELIQNNHWEGEIMMRHRSNKMFPVYTSAAALTNENGDPIGYSMVCFDMTNQAKQASRLRRDKEKAERAALAKQDFLSTMSHEIRTPLNVVVNMARLLMDESPRADQLEYMKSLQFSANHLLVIINDILDFAKIEAGKIKLEEISFSPREVAEGITKAFQFRAKEKNISLRLDWGSNIPEYILGDEVRLTQILNNLVGNAIKFTEKGFVSVHTELLSKQHDKYKIRFEVRDTGIGIPADRMKSIFQDYTQGGDDTTRRFGGTGLGLTICKRLIDMQNGKLSVRSKEGWGSNFSFVLTYQHDAKSGSLASASAKERIDTSKLSGKKLLLVEDNPSNRMVATSFLEKVGIRVSTAENGKQAIDRVQQEPFDIVLMDLQMPVMNGCEASHAIRNLGEDYQKLPIIALTADVVQGVKDRVRECGMNDYLPKPFNPDELHYKIALNLGLISPQEADFATAEEKSDIMQLHRLIDQYNDDVKFVTNLLDSLRQSFQLLTEQVASSADQKDVYELRRLTHKLLPSIKMVGNHELHTHLDGLKEALADDKIDEAEVAQLIKKVQNSSTKSINYIDELVTNMKEHRGQLTSS